MTSLKKSVLYRIYSLIIMGAFFYFITGSVKQMTFFALGIEIVKTIQYHVFEVLWSRFP
ncbi:MAG: DUF2061 domain-containing protein [Candidatus Altiarchaeota archaeon]|nr:DUF2061 domain-containing protein [Candidatus Altiarchaeota archaeon]MBU4341014.1 DUF2061 domain-containing protein [Candidatus Altiarchaeota archaeon]